MKIKICFSDKYCEDQSSSWILGEVFDPLEGGDELEGDEALLVPLDVLQQELVLGDVGVREVELDLVNKNNGKWFQYEQNCDCT